MQKSAIVLPDLIKGWTNNQKFSPEEIKKKKIKKTDLSILEKKDLKFTISFWFKNDNSPENSYQNNNDSIGHQKYYNKNKENLVKIINRNESPLLEFNTDNNTLILSTRIKIIEEGKNTTKSEKYNLGEIPSQRWNHICISLEGRNFDYYLNGKLKWSFILKNVPYVVSGSLNIFEPQKEIYAQISYIRIFSEVLDPIKVKFLYKNGSGRNTGIFPSGKFFSGLLRGNDNYYWYPQPNNAIIDWYWLV